MMVGVDMCGMFGLFLLELIFVVCIVVWNWLVGVEYFLVGLSGCNCWELFVSSIGSIECWCC